jgi:2',3'-cyclic-nucleotide 2'-phosphodiesterase (5'-nucleotidase family)
VIEGLAKSVRFPLLSSSIYELNSLRDAKGSPVQAESVGCKAAGGAVIDFKQAKRPAFLSPYRVQNVAGVRVALIGLDHPESPKTTTPENVTDLCFRDPVAQYRETRAELEGRADVFIILLHNGDTSQNKTVSASLFKLLDENPRAFDLVVAGHTHAVNQESSAQGVRFVQSGSSAERIGRVDLVYDLGAGQVLHDRTQSAAGVILQTRDCEQKAYFCSLDAAGKVHWDGVALEADAEIARAIREGSAEVSALSRRELGVAEAALRRHRTDESALANILTDIFRALSGAEIAFMNTGGIRVDLLQGPITYGAFFEVLPFNNRGVELQPMGFDKVYSLLLRSIQTCGSYGALMQSGLRVEYTRDCTGVDTIDPLARLDRVTTVAGEVLYDLEQGINRGDRKLTVTTLDFLAAGGSGYDGFKGVPHARDLGVVREAMTEHLLLNPGRFQGVLDGRWRNLKTR